MTVVDGLAGRTKAAAPVGTAVVSALLALVILLAQVPTLLQVIAMPDWNGYGAADYELYMNAAQTWLDTGVFYHPHQLAGPYHIVMGDVLYPPVILWLLVPFTFLPGFLWWAIPLGVTAWVLWKLHPGPLAWPLMAAVLAWQPVQIHVISGNPGLWSMMFLALGTLYRWPAAFAFLKPTIGIFGLFGIRSRQWWYGFAAFCALSLAVLPMWFDWLTVVGNGDASIAYSWQEAPMMLLPLIAWACRPGGRYGSRQQGVGRVRDRYVAGGVRVNEVAL